MKRIMSVLAVAMMVLVGMIAAGCVTTGTSMMGNDGQKIAISGPVPQVGDMVYVQKDQGHETIGPYVYDMIWSSTSSISLPKICRTTGGRFAGLEGEGLYAIVRNPKGEGIYFAKTH